MRRVTTPTHTFTFPEEVSLYDKVEITYRQANEILLKKYKDDLEINGKTAKLMLTQEETKSFKVNVKAEVQIRVKANDSVLATSIIPISVTPSISEDIL